jgi:hypothetical protein
MAGGVVPTVEGFTRGYAFQRRYSGLGDGTPLLSNFYFGFGVGKSDPPDNHVLGLEILPGGHSEDLSPIGELSPTNVPEGMVEIFFRDEDPTSSDDEYFYTVTHHALGAVARYQVRDVGGREEIDRVLPAAIVHQVHGVRARSFFALCGFKLFFIGNEDHHVSRIAIRERNGHLITSLSDESKHTFGYLVDFALVPGGPGSPAAALSRIVLGQSSGTSRGGDRARISAPPQSRLVLRGFDFEYVGTNKDNHVRDFGITSNGEFLEVYFGDAEPNTDADRFSWTVEWATIGPPLVVGPVTTGAGDN